MTPFRVLLIDDQRIVGASIKRMLADTPHIHLSHCLDPREAPEWIAREVPDVILLDLVMPEVSGIELLCQLRGQESLRQLPIVVLSTREDPVVKSEAFGAGATDYLVKLPDKVEMIARLRSHARAGRAQRDLVALVQQLKLTQSQLETANAQLARANTELEYQSARDGLTGIANRRMFDETLSREWRRASRDGTSMVLLLVDVDRFKLYNDRYGHPAGDRCLIKVAACLSDSLKRPGDLVARYGGEEFVAILPNTGPEAVAVAERLVTSVAAEALEHQGSEWGVVTISVGLAWARPGPDQEAASLVEAADGALYQAKANGRNRVELAPPPAGLSTAA